MGDRWGLWQTNRHFWRVSWVWTPRSKARALCASAIASISRWLRLRMYRGFCRAQTRNTAASSNKLRKKLTPSPRPPDPNVSGLQEKRAGGGIALLGLIKFVTVSNKAWQPQGD